MNAIFETLGKTLVVIGCGIIQLISVIFNGIGMLFGIIGVKLGNLNTKILTKISDRKKEKVTKKNSVWV